MVSWIVCELEPDADSGEGRAPHGHEHTDDGHEGPGRRERLLVVFSHHPPPLCGVAQREEFLIRQLDERGARVLL